MTKTSVIIEAALSYAKRGWKLFPLEELGKQPRISIKDGGKGVHDATTDKKQIETWFSRFPNANIGLHAETFFVLDVDPKNNGTASLENLVRTYGPLPDTLRQRTPSGGTHYLFTSPVGFLVKNRAGFHPGLDTRSYGGYIVATPSYVVEDGYEGGYTWENEGTPIAEAPDWLLSLVKDKREGFKKVGRSDSGSRDIDDASLAGYLMNGGLTEDETLGVLMRRNDDQDQRDIPLPSNEVLKTVRSIYKRDVRTPAGLRQALQERKTTVIKEGAVVAAPDQQWEERLIRSSTGVPKNILANADACLTHSPLFCAALAFDELQCEAILTRNVVDPASGKPMYHLTAGSVINEHITREMLSVAQRLITSVTFSEDTLGAAIQMVARQNTFHPVQDWLNSLLWDSKLRIDTMLVDHFGVEDTPYARGISRRWLISAVERALNPGCMAKSMLIIEGAQDAGKSTALRTLCGVDWFKDTTIDFSNKDRFGALRGVWIYELAEFDQYKGSDVAAVKSFISSPRDTYRPPYGRGDIKQPRSNVFVGTVNPDKYLTDTTGDVRYWPVKCVKFDAMNPINFKRIEDLRDQLWAEAVRAYYNGDKGFLDTPELKNAHRVEALARHDDDPWEREVILYVDSHNGKIMHTSDIMRVALDIPLSRQSSREQGRVKRLLEQSGFEYASVRENGKVTKTWRKKITSGLL